MSAELANELGANADLRFRNRKDRTGRVTSRPQDTDLLKAPPL